MAEGRGKAQAASLRKSRRDVSGFDGREEFGGVPARSAQEIVG
jgi:high-affinity K+ transport system ATPase subunit B